MKQDLLFDKRLQRRFLRDHILTRETLEKHLATLRDASDQALYVNVNATGAGASAADASAAKKKK